MTAPLSIPAGVSLDGAGHTISLVGDAAAFESAAVRVTAGEVTDLTIDGSRLDATAPEWFAAITLSAPGRITQVTVANLQFSGARSVIGIEVAAFAGQAAALDAVTLVNIAGAGVLACGDGAVTVRDLNACDVTAAIQLNGAVSATVSGLSVELSGVALAALDHTRVRLLDEEPAALAVLDQARVRQDKLTFIAAPLREADVSASAGEELPEAGARV
ncbi:MAG: hypothetical protein QM692_10695 [Thermomicrobiales bacterium]